MTTPIPTVRPQAFANHRAVDGSYLVAGLVLVVNVVVQCAGALRDPQPATIWPIFAAAAVVVVWRTSRAKAQVMQDRVIRLEMRLRLERVLPVAQRGDIDRLTLDQLIALRFASDAELPALARDVLAQGVTKRDDIKRRVKDWQADWLRV